MATLKYYFDFMSPPSRALYIILKANKIPFEPVSIALRKGEHLTDEYRAVNRFQKVPCIVDNDFHLAESNAIFLYLHGQGKINDKWYPKDIKKRCRIDEYLSWQHNNLRMHCALYFFEKWIKLLTQRSYNREKVAILKQRLDACLDEIENLWLQDHAFITGDKITFADLLAVSDIETTRLCGHDPKNGRTKLAKWMELVKSETEPLYSETFKYLNLNIEKTKHLMNE